MVVLSTMTMATLQDEGTYRGGDPAERSRGFHGREHFPHRDSNNIPHHLRGPLKGACLCWCCTVLVSVLQRIDVSTYWCGYCNVLVLVS